MQEMFAAPPYNKIFATKCIQIFPQLNVILPQMFSIYTAAQMFINTRLLPLISSTFQLHEMAQMWLINRLHTIVEHRQKTRIPRVDLLQQMLQAANKETIIVSTMFRIWTIIFLTDHLPSIGQQTR
jgi:hypothetical protein